MPCRLWIQELLPLGSKVESRHWVLMKFLTCSHMNTLMCLLSVHASSNTCSGEFKPVHSFSYKAIVV